MMQPSTYTPNADWMRVYRDAETAEAGKPKFEGEVNGLEVGPEVEVVQDSDCPAKKWEYLDPGAASGTDLEIVTRYLPPGARMSGILEVEGCGTKVASVLQYYGVQTKRDHQAIVWAGGGFVIARIAMDSASQLPWSHSRDQTTIAQIAGRTVLIASPLTPEGIDVGRGRTYIVVKEPFGFTWITGTGLPLSEFLKIAEGLYSE